VFTIAGTNQGVIQNVAPGAAETDRPLNSRTAPAIPGSYWGILWGTGLGANVRNGQLLPDFQPAPVNPLDVPVTVLVGGKSASVQFKGRAPGFSGADNIYFIVPADAPTGCAVPVQVQAGDSPPVTVTMAIDPSGKTCVDR
jgi:uncharacterized protein (TIGR03437 family)